MSKVYHDELMSLGKGHPLWCPEPHSSGEAQIGDVGYIFEGAFVRLFNAISPEEFQVPNSRLPPDFEALELPEGGRFVTHERDMNPGHWTGSSVTRVRIGSPVEEYVFTLCSHVDKLTGE